MKSDEASQALDSPDSWPGPFLEWLRAGPVEVTPGRARLELVVLPQHLRTLGIMHGGVLATLLDSVLGVAAGSLAPPGHFVVTVQLNINFIRPAWAGETLVATGEVRHAGQQTAVARGEVHTAKGALVGSGSATFMFILLTDPAKAKFAQHENDQPRAGGRESSL